MNFFTNVATGIANNSGNRIHFSGPTAAPHNTSTPAGFRSGGGYSTTTPTLGSGQSGAAGSQQAPPVIIQFPGAGGPSTTSSFGDTSGTDTSGSSSGASLTTALPIILILGAVAVVGVYIVTRGKK